MIKGHDKQEVIEIAKKHGKEKHNLTNITDDDLKAMMKTT